MVNALYVSTILAGGDIRQQKLEFHHTHLDLGALGYIETFLFLEKYCEAQARDGKDRQGERPQT